MLLNSKENQTHQNIETEVGRYVHDCPVCGDFLIVDKLATLEDVIQVPAKAFAIQSLLQLES